MASTADDPREVETDVQNDQQPDESDVQNDQQPVETDVQNDQRQVETDVHNDQKHIKPKTLVDIVQRLPGDLYIKVGIDNDTGVIRVHRNTMMMNSSYFRVLLGGDFSEARRGYDEDSAVVLEDDDRQSFTILCQVLHLQSFDKLSAQENLAKIAVIADKYRCAEAVLPVIISTMHNQVYCLLEGPEYSEERAGILGNIVCAAFLAKERHLFWQASRALIIQVNGFASFQYDRVLTDPIIPNELSEASCTVQQETLLSLVETTSARVKNELLARFDSRHHALACQRARELMGIWELELDEMWYSYGGRGDGGRDDALETMSCHTMSYLLKKIGRRIRSMVDGPTMVPCRTHPAQGLLRIPVSRAPYYDMPDAPHVCEAESIDLQFLIFETVNGFLADIEGLCLACWDETGKFGEKCKHFEGDVESSASDAADVGASNDIAKAASTTD